MFDIYHKYTPQQIRDEIGWKNGVGTDDLSTAIMVLCDIIASQQTAIDRLLAAVPSAGVLRPVVVFNATKAGSRIDDFGGGDVKKGDEPGPDTGD